MSKRNGINSQTNGHGLIITSAAEFRRLREFGEVTTLSSGRVVRWRPVNLARMLKAGRIPDHLTNFVTSLVWTDDHAEERSPREQAIEWQDYLDWVSEAALLSPRVVNGLQPLADDEILVDDLTYDEQLDLNNLARGLLKEVRPFPDEQSADLGAVQQGEQGEPAAA